MKRSTRFLHSAAFLIISTSALAQSTWNTNTTGSWTAAGNWSSGGVPASAATTQLVFNATGTQSYTTTNNIGTGTFTLNRITVSNSGSGIVTIAGNTTSNTLTFAGTTPTLDITGTALFTGRMVGSATVTKTGGGSFIHDSNNTGFTGVINVNAGTFINRATTNATTNFNPTSIVVNNGATYQFGESTTGDPNLPNTTYVTANTGGMVIWEEGETFGGFNLQGGTIDLELGGVTSSGTSPQSWTSGTLTGSGSGATVVGGVTAINKTTSGTVNITGNASITTTTGGLNIQEGTIAMAGSGNLGTASIALGAASTSGTFEYQGTTATRGGDFAVNAGGGAIGITNAAANLTLSGNFSGAGALSKTGAGTLSLIGALGGAGLTTVNAGSLRVNPVTAAGGLASSAGTSLIINTGDASASLTTPTLSLSDTSTLLFELNTASISNTPMVVVSTADGLTSAGTTTLKLTNLQPFANGTYTLINYDGAAITSGYSLSLPGRTNGALVYDTANTEIDLSISGTDTVKWTGANNSTWDVGTAPGVGGTQNFQLFTAGTATNFIETDIVLFDDTATSFTVELATSVLPTVATVNATSNYLFSGAGKISGASGLAKSGTGKLTLATNNDYAGTTTINEGILEIGNGGTTGSVGTGAISIATGSTLRFNRTDTTTFSNAFSGTGMIEVAGGVVNQTVDGSFTGNVDINGGTYRVTLDADLNSDVITVNNTGTFIFGNATAGNPNLLDTAFVTVNAGGQVIWEEGENLGGFHLIGGSVELRELSSNPNFMGTTASDFQSGTITRTGTSNIGGTGVINKTTNGTVTITGVELNNTGGLNIQEGVLSTNADIVDTGAATLGTVSTGATLRLTKDTSVTYNKVLTLNHVASSVMEVTNAAGTVVWSGTVGGIGGLTKTGLGTLNLTGEQSYNGGTTVSNGILRQGASINFLPHGAGKGDVIVSRSAVIELGGFSETANGLSGDGTVRNTAATNVNLEVGLDNDTASFAGLLENGIGGGILSFTKSGTGTQTLSGNNTYTGATAINGGTLVITGATQATSAITFTAGGILGLDTATSVSAASATVDFTGQSVLVSGPTGAPSYTLLTASSITGVPVLATPVSGYALQVVNNQLLLVQSGGGSPFDTWSGSLAFDADANGDGISNGMAWLLGAASPAADATALLPVVTQTGGNLVLTFSSLNAASRGTATVTLQHSSDLGLADPWFNVGVPESTSTVSGVTFTVTADGTMNDVIATVPASEAVAGKLFGRIIGQTAP